MNGMIEIPRSTVSRALAAIANAESKGTFSECAVPKLGEKLIEELAGYVAVPEPRADWHVVAYTELTEDGPKDVFTTHESREEADTAFYTAKQTKKVLQGTVARMTNNRTDWM